MLPGAKFCRFHDTRRWIATNNSHLVRSSWPACCCGWRGNIWVGYSGLFLQATSTFPHSFHILHYASSVECEMNVEMYMVWFCGNCWETGSCDYRWSVMGIVCQVLSRRTKNWSHFINIWDTVTNVVPFCSVYQAPSYEPNLTLLSWFLQDLAFLSMLFILEVLCTACSAEHLKNK